MVQYIKVVEVVVVVVDVVPNSNVSLITLLWN